ncbi:MAG TPA: restriction endonuclease subunit S [Polyangia bacterium]|jgi:Restriction endonuclease S subunits|nr:restriction endonuclease subunit S [Polyangia bacterium]
MKGTWERALFEDCVEKVTYTRKVQRKDFLPEGEHPIVSQEEEFINGYWNQKADLFSVERPIIVFGDHTKVLKYVDFDFVLGADGVKILQPREFLLPRFFYYQLQTANLESLGYARHYRLLKELEIVYPPLPEQRRIVGILDEAFEGIATAKANAEKNLQNARALFESHLQSVFAGAWQACQLVSLSELATDITDGDHLPPPKAPTGVPFITIGNVAKDTRKIDLTDTFMVPRAYFDGLKENKKPRRGDVLYTVTGSFGIPVVVDADIEFCFQRHIGLIRPKSQISTSWLSYLLLSPQVFAQANERATGTAQKTVSLNVLRKFTVPNVPPKDQRAAAARLDALSAETDRLASIYQQKLAALEALKKSLLHQAFSGEL